MSSANTQVKDCIVQLCRLLKYAPVPVQVSPDSFRQAKQNKPNAVDAMLNVVLSLLPLIDDSATSLNSKSPSAVSQISEILHKHNYPRAPLIIQQDTSSFELLMSVGWLLHCTKVLTTVNRNALKVTSTFDLLKNQKFRTNTWRPGLPEGQHNGESTTDRNRLENFAELSLPHQMNYIKWRTGKIEVSSNSLASLKCYNSGLDAKVMLATKQESAKNEVDFLTADEALLLKHPKLLQMCEKDLERKIQILQAFQKWKELEPAFWNWMKSGLESDDSIDPLQLQPNEQPMTTVAECDELQDDVKRTLKCFEELRATLYEGEKEWLQLAKTDSDRLSKVRVEQEHRIQSEVNSYLQLVHNTDGEPRLLPMLEKGRDPKQFVLPISEEIRRLDKEACQLSGQLLHQRRICAEELTLLANTRLDENVILVPATTIS